MKNYKIDWLYLGAIAWLFVVGAMFSMLFLDEPWSILYYKTLGFFFMASYPFVIFMSVRRKDSKSLKEEKLCD